LQAAGVEYRPGTVDDHTGKLPLRRMEQAREQQMANMLLSAVLPSLAESEGFNRLPPAQRKLVVQRLVERVHQAVDRATLAGVVTQSGPEDVANRVVRQALRDQGATP